MVTVKKWATNYANFLKITDPRLDAYLQSANRRVSQAFRPSTQKNHRHVLKLFIGFALALHQEYSDPSVSLIMAFTEHLACTQRTAAAVISSIGTLKSVLKMNNISIRNFFAHSVEMQLRSIKINKRTPAVQRPPARLRELRMIISHLTQMDYACHLKVAVLLLFTTAFHQSNLAPSSARGFDATRHLLRADVRLAANHVQVREKWSKTVNKFLGIAGLRSPGCPALHCVSMLQ